MARMRALILAGDSKGHISEKITIRDLLIHHGHTRSLSVQEKTFSLTPTEFEILHILPLRIQNV